MKTLAATQGAWIRMIPSKRAQLTYTSGAFHQICEFGDITLNNITESSYLDIKFYRKDGTGLPATVWMLGFDLHIPLISLGTPNEYPSH